MLVIYPNPIYAQKCKGDSIDRSRILIDLKNNLLGVLNQLRIFQITQNVMLDLHYLLGRGCLSRSPLFSLCSLSFISFSFSLTKESKFLNILHYTYLLINNSFKSLLPTKCYRRERLTLLLKLISKKIIITVMALYITFLCFSIFLMNNIP